MSAPCSSLTCRSRGCLAWHCFWLVGQDQLFFLLDGITPQIPILRLARAAIRLQDHEVTDRRLINTMMVALLRRWVSRARVSFSLLVSIFFSFLPLLTSPPPPSPKVCPERVFLYWYAVHHVHRFVFGLSQLEEGDEAAVAADHRLHMAEQLLTVASDALYRDLLFYNVDDALASPARPPFPCRGDAPLPAAQAARLRAVLKAKAELRPVAATRHPSLLAELTLDVS